MKTLWDLAKEAGLEESLGSWCQECGIKDKHLERFRALCMEEAAQLCIELGKEHPKHIESPVYLVAKWCASSIREAAKQ